MKVTKNITIDLNNPRRHVVHLMESGNQREIVLTLLKDGMPFDVSEGIGTATLVKGVGYIKANGVPGYYDWTSTDLVAVEAVTGSTNKWTVRLDEHATDVPGFAQIFVKFSLASGETLYSFPIVLDVIKTSGGTTDPDSPWYHSSSFILVGAQASKTDDMTSPVGIDADGKLWIKSQGGISDDAKAALLELLSHVAYDGPDGLVYYNALEAALYSDHVLTGITADYEQDHAVYDTDELDVIKQGDDLTVTAHYDDGVDVVVYNYTLSGTLEVGTCEITVSYGGKTDTIEVNVLAAPVPAGYTMIQYVERPSSASTTEGYNDTGFKPNGTDDLVVHISCEVLDNPSSSSGGYFLCCWQTSSHNSVGFGVLTNQAATTIGAYDGTSCNIEPEGSGVSVKNHKYNLTVTKTTTALTVTDGEHTNTVTRTPRAMWSNLYLFGCWSGSSVNMPMVGRIYSLDISEGNVEKVKLIPCRRNNDNAVGFWNPYAQAFLTSEYTAGPDVVR